MALQQIANTDIQLNQVYPISTINSGTGNALTLQTNNTTAVTIDTAGEVGIGTTNPSARLNVVESGSVDALRITQTGAGNALVVEDSANPDATPFVVDANGKAIVGHTSALATVAYSGAALIPNLQTQGVGMGVSALGVANWANNNQSPASIVLSKSKSNAVGTFGVVASGDVLGSLSFTGDDGTAFINAAYIQARVDGTPGTSNMPGRLVFSTTADGASSPTERMRIDNAGQVGIGSTPAAGRSLVVGKNITGSIASRAITSIGAVQSDVTTLAAHFATNASTAAAAFTLPSLFHYQAIQGSIGAGSTVTNQYGYYTDSSLTGATNNFGFYSAIASGTGRYNFYAAGTADNYFAGNTTIAGDATLATVKSATITAANSNTVEATSGPTSTQLAGMRNRIINGAMQVWQRGTSFTNPANSYQYTADRWYVFSGTTLPATSGQVATGRQDFPYALRVQRPNGNTSTSNTLAGQVIESINCRDLSGQTVSISFYARAGSNYSTTSNALGVWVATGTGTDQGALNQINNAWTSQAYIQNSVTLTTSFVKYSVSVAIPAGTNEIALMFLTFPTGTAGANDYFDITGVQLEPGATVTPFEYRLYGTELSLCQRYFERTSPGNGTSYCVGASNGTSELRATLPFKVPKRSAPTMSFAAASTFLCQVAATNYGVSAIATFGSSVNSTWLQVTSTGMNTGYCATLIDGSATSSYIDASAEL